MPQKSPDEHDSENEKDDAIEKVTDESETQIIPLEQAPTGIDISALPTEQRAELQMMAAKGLIEAQTQRAAAQTETEALSGDLESIVDAVKTASEQETAATMSYVKNTKTSRLESRIGNTPADYAGKLSKSATGERDWRPIYIILSIVAVVLVAIAIANNL